MLAVILHFLASAAFIVFALYLRTMTAVVCDGRLTVNSGFFIKRTKVFPDSRILYVTAWATPLERCFKNRIMKIRGLSLNVWFFPLAESEIDGFMAACGVTADEQ